MEPSASPWVMAVLGMLMYALVLSTLRVLGARVRLTLKRHDLLVASKQRRIDFYREQAARQQQEAAGDVPTEAELQYDVIVEDEPLRQAA